jgi:protein-tyrosine phosphatase
VPASRRETANLATRLAGDLAEGRNVGIHCRQGIGRSALVIAAVLMASGFDPGSALQKVTAARGYPVPETPEQRQWVFDLAEFLTPVPR